MIEPCGSFDKRVERAIFEAAGEESFLTCPDCGKRMEMRAFVSTDLLDVLASFRCPKCPRPGITDWSYDKDAGEIWTLCDKKQAVEG